MVIYIKDTRDNTKDIKDPFKCNEVAHEMLEYFKRLEKKWITFSRIKIWILKSNLTSE